MSLDERHDASAVEWMTIHEAASLMGVSPATLRRWSDAGDIRTFTTPGGHRRFSRSAIADLLPAEPTEATVQATHHEGVHRRLHREVGRAMRAFVHEPWAATIDPEARATIEVLGDRMLRAAMDGICASDDEREPHRVVARRTAAALGAVTAANGVPLAILVESCLGLRAAVARELLAATRRQDLDPSTAAHWLGSMLLDLDELVVEAMRAHAASTA